MAVNCCVEPEAIDGFAGVTVIEVSCDATPTPCRVAVCGLLLALSTTVSVPESWPTAKGANVTLITQVPDGDMDAGQVVATKGPVVVTLVTLNAVDGRLLKVTVLAGLMLPTT